MIRINNIRVGINQKNYKNILEREILSKLDISKERLISWEINKRSLDARRKNKIIYIYSINIEVLDENEVLNNIKNPNIFKTVVEKYENKIKSRILKGKPPVIIGAGPSALFCALILAENNLNPIIIEQGKMIEERIKDINEFWEKAILNPKSNVQFGEGGAGTFSDGKLTTLVKDKKNRINKILEEFIEAGGPEEIKYVNNPHIGTDKLRRVVINLRKKIQELGGVFYFQETFKDLGIKEGEIQKVITDKREIETDDLVLAIGHSSRDTFKMLNNYIEIIPKPFAIGLRIEHKREDIDKNQYGKIHKVLPSAEYKLVHHEGNRSIYSFCMCPGGYVVGASSKENMLVINGMSNYKRDAENSNSALLVNITPKDYYIDSPLDGIKFQEKWEGMAFEIGGKDYNAPVQLFGDLMNNTRSSELGDIVPSYKPGYKFANLRECLPDYVIENIIIGVKNFSDKIDNFDRYDSILTGVETRSSSPIRIKRDDNYQSSIKGIYPCGEGAGYAGGIMSSAIDGIKIAEKILGK